MSNSVQLRAVDAQHDVVADDEDAELEREAALEMERENDEFDARMLDGVRDAMQYYWPRSVERDALELALTVLNGQGDYRARRSLQLMQRIARKLSEPVHVYQHLRLISDRPLG